MNWCGRPLTSHEVVVRCIAATTTRNGLRVEAELDRGAYPLGLAISKAQLTGLPIEPHAARGTWNYTIHPGHGPDEALTRETGGQAARRQLLDLLAELA
jgi:hypothetical protein